MKFMKREILKRPKKKKRDDRKELPLNYFKIPLFSDRDGLKFMKMIKRGKRREKEMKGKIV